MGFGERARMAPGSSATLDEGTRPTVRELLDGLTFDPLEGRIWLHERRMVLLHHEALSLMRDELVRHVGIEPARRILTHAGYLAGVRDAESVAARWPHARLEAMLLAGMRLHTLQGRLKAQHKQFQFDAGAGTFSGEFYWRHSVEHEGSASPLGSEATCWNAVGYASGYTTTLLGTLTVFREVECAAAGGSQCRVIGRTAREWGDEIADDLRYLGAQGIATAGLPLAPDVGGGEGPSAALPSLAEADESAWGGAASTGEGSRLIGVSAAFTTACELVRRAASTRATVLFIGESGVGKELFARSLHDLGPRRGAPFVSVNCAALPETLIEAELFGVERGAFTGATQSRAGRFERAHGGTLFLDEVASLSLATQAKLLRALQEGEVERVGGQRAIRVDLRLVAACNVDLRNEVREGRFREDLFYRLNVCPIRLPPLRDRSEDIPLLMGHFLALYNARHGRRIAGFTPRAVRALLTYRFPGNVRELQNLVERGVVMADDGVLMDLPHLLRDEVLDEPPVLSPGTGGRLSLVPGGAPNDGLLDKVLGWRETAAAPHTVDWLEGLEGKVIEEAIARCGGNLTAAARLLGMTRPKLAYRMRKHRTLAG